MAERTGVQWCDATFNIAWGCTKVSPGCKHCYAERDAKRYGHAVWGADAPRRVFGEKHWSDPLRWLRNWNAAGQLRPMRIFTSSMADVFEDHPSIAQERAKLWPLIRSTDGMWPWRARAEWLVVTKRPENFTRFLPDDWGNGYPNVMLLVTAENQECADERVPILLRTPAAMRGVSYEPALGPVDFDFREIEIAREVDGHGTAAVLGGLDWVIVGGESGPGARPFDVAWARSTVAQCKAAGVPVFVKQLGAAPYDSLGIEAHATLYPEDARTIVGKPTDDDLEAMGRLLDAAGIPFRVAPGAKRDRKGGDMEQWPETIRALRVREFPSFPKAVR